jgi:hypothetical protein
MDYHKPLDLKLKDYNKEINPVDKFAVVPSNWKVTHSEM